MARRCIFHTLIVHRDESIHDNPIVKTSHNPCLVKDVAISKSSLSLRFQGVMSARSSSFAVARTTSQGSRRSRMTRSSTWGNSRFAEGPPVQPKSQLKELRSWSKFVDGYGWNQRRAVKA